MQTALITGVSKGIGKATAELLLADGWQVLGISRSDPQLSHPQFTWLEFDLMKFDQYPQLKDRLPEKLDLLINNAGIAYAVPLERIIHLDLDKQWAMNVKAPILLIITLLSKLAQGRIINIASVAAYRNYTDLSVYGTTKAAIVKFGRQFAAESPIPLLTISPAGVDTPMFRTLNPGEDYSLYLQGSDIAQVIRQQWQTGWQNGAEIVVINDWQKEDAEGLPEKVEVVNVNHME